MPGGPKRNESTALVDFCVRIKKDGQRCQKRPIIGGTVCHSHGGRVPNTRAKADQRVAEIVARQQLARFAEPVKDSDPYQQLQHRLDVQVGIVAWIEQQLRSTPEHLSGMVALVESFTDSGHAGVPVGNGPALIVREDSVTKNRETGDETKKIELKINPLLTLYRDERKVLTDLCAAMIKVGFEAKLVDARVAEAKLAVAPVVELLRGLVDDPRLAAVADVLKLVIGEHVRARRSMIEGAS